MRLFRLDSTCSAERQNHFHFHVVHLVPHGSECDHEVYISRVQESDTVTPTDYLKEWSAPTQQSTVLMERETAK